MTVKKIEVSQNSTVECGDGPLLISVRKLGPFSDEPKRANVTVGAIGHANVTRELFPGDLILFSAGDKGEFEVRLLQFAGPHDERAVFQVARLK